MDYPESLQDYALDEIRRSIQTGVYPVSSKLAPPENCRRSEYQQYPRCGCFEPFSLSGTGGANSASGFHRQAVFHAGYPQLFRHPHHDGVLGR